MGVSFVFISLYLWSSCPCSLVIFFQFHWNINKSKPYASYFLSCHFFLWSSYLYFTSYIASFTELFISSDFSWCPYISTESSSSFRKWSWLHCPRCVSGDGISCNFNLLQLIWNDCSIFSSVNFYVQTFSVFFGNLYL